MNTIEPPVLMSRILTFVFAAALATVVVLVVTLSNLLPLSKTQVFFLTTQPRENTEIVIQSAPMNDGNIEAYKENFIKEYIKLRNEVIPNFTVMRRRWWTGEGGIINTWSSPEVYAAFTQTRMWQAIMSDLPDFEFRCNVEFTKPIAPRKPEDQGFSSYAVSFRYFCTNNALQTDKKDYTIVIGIKFQETIKWATRLENPLGIYVSEYTVESGGSDPLDFAQ